MTARAAKVAFVLPSPTANPLPSTRISVLNMLPHLRAAGFEPSIAFEPHTATETPDISGLAAHLERQAVDIAYLQKVHGPSVQAEVGRLKAAGIRCVYGVCDRIDDDMVRACDATVTVTEFLRHQHRADLHSRIFVVHDSIEQPQLQHPGARPDAGLRGPLRAVLVTSSTLLEIPFIGKPPRWLDLTVVGRYAAPGAPGGPWQERIKRAIRGPGGATLEPLLPAGFRALPWHPQGVYDTLLQADIAIIPVDMRADPLPGRTVSHWEVKSENRLTLKMALGLPVITSPVPAYLDVIEHGVNGFLAHTTADWHNALQALRDPGLRARIGQAARASVIDRFSTETQARALVGVLDSLRKPAPLKCI